MRIATLSTTEAEAKKLARSKPRVYRMDKRDGWLLPPGWIVASYKNPRRDFGDFWAVDFTFNGRIYDTKREAQAAL